MDVKKVKGLIANDSLRIELHDLIVEKLQRLISELESKHFSTDTEFLEEEFKKRVNRIEELTDDLSTIQILLFYWGSKKQKQNYNLALRRLANANSNLTGKTVWIFLRWYPVVLLFYYSGISAVAGNNYKKLFGLMNQTVSSPTQSQNRVSLIQAIIKGFSRLNGDPFGIVCENKNSHVPRSDYLFRLIKDRIDNFLFLNSEYEPIFDRFEVIFFLEYAYQTAGDSPENARGPIGRFGYKRRGNNNPLANLIEEANSMSDDWPPLQAGMFGGSVKRFKEISTLLSERVDKLRWYY
jgi:hypothetical protein